jgi:hypothetical protein
MNTQPTTSDHEGRSALRRFAHDLREALIFPPVDSDLPRLRDYPFLAPPIGGH